MENNKKDDEIQSRREFFKNAARKTLPILGALLVANNPLLANSLKVEESENPTGCEWDCSMGCKGGCGRSCSYNCSGSCSGTCSGACKASCCRSCSYNCSGSCSGYCSSSVPGDIDEI